MSLQNGQPQTAVSTLATSEMRSITSNVFQADGKPHEHWRYLLDSLQNMDPAVFAERQAKARRILRDDGATYNIYNDQETSSHSWQLDLVPSLISSENWGTIESGLLERAELFNLLLKDIYGPRNLIRQGVIPPEVLFDHPGFLRACNGISLPGEHDLILHSADLMQDAEGNICVLADKTQSPSGAGYALENRTVMSRVLPSLFRDSHVHRLAPFFQRLRSKLTSLAPNQDQPHVVVLTPGPHNETYFEHAYLANYLGLHLVQSGDLVVRNGFVWMKSLDGLRRVDVILRRVDDWFCDPVELRSDSQLGVPSLLEAARAGRVAIANPLGSGILENPVLVRYLPAIAKALLGRELRLNSVPTYWCGDKADMAFVTSHLDDLVIKPFYRNQSSHSLVPSSMTQNQKQELITRIKRQPRQFIAQAKLLPSYLPSHVDGSLKPLPTILRSFAVASGSSYVVMPGGLTRTGTHQDVFTISNQAGSFSKDTWVIASEPERAQPSRDDTQTATNDKIEQGSLPSRVVENLFWMGRYTERAESSLRLLRTVFLLMNSENASSLNCRRTLLQTVTAATATHPGFMVDNDELILAPEKELQQVIANPHRFGGVRFNLTAMLNCADQCKELLSPDMLRVINDIRDTLSSLDNTFSGAPEETLNPLVTALMALSGLIQESMVRSTGWRFIEIGRRLERSQQTTTIIRHLLANEMSEADQHSVNHALLLTLEVLISYRRRYGTRMQIPSCLNMVMLDIGNPRSLLYQLDQLNQHLASLRKPNSYQELQPEERAALEAETHIRLSLLHNLSRAEDGKRKALDEHLEHTSKLLDAISNFISEKYFDHRENSQQLVQNVWEMT